MEIKVKPEQLEQIAKNISEMQTHSRDIQQNLNQSMFSIQMQWQGATSQHFYGEYMRSMGLMESYIRNLQITEKELRRIAQKFRQADEEYQKKQTGKLKETPKKEEKHEKSWWEKGLEGAAEFIGINDAIRAVTGKDPITGKELSTKERLIAAGWTLLNFIPVGKVASLVGKGIKYVASGLGKTIVKVGKGLGEGVTMVAGKAGKAAVDSIKTATHKVKEGVSFVASTAKGLADKIGSLWNKGATIVKTTFLQEYERIQYAAKTLSEYNWISGVGNDLAMSGVGRISGIGQHSLKDAYQYMKSVGEKGVKGTGEAAKYDVGLYNEIKGVPGLDAHHIGQKAIMKKFIADYDPKVAPAILVPKVGHTIRGPKGIVSRSSKGIENGRQLLARDIMELRRVYPDIPNSQIKKLIELNKKLYPELRRK
ncbi:WXG100 family type VII secretion target [Bacillus paramycoides]|uniref:WXG100 family type VII secretion target n=1 Tax=Bacillus paramycoides TaxID=2026194 RepID=UPI001C4C04A1|nr:WXG100 family type VII secretion target [Bacillus paramycoides]